MAWGPTTDQGLGVHCIPSCPPSQRHYITEPERAKLPSPSPKHMGSGSTRVCLTQVPKCQTTSQASRNPNLTPNSNTKKVKVAHTRLPSIGFHS